MISYDYQCHACGVIKTNQELDTFACACGGSYHLVDRAIASHHSEFEPHFNETIKDWVYSWSDMEAKGKRFRSKDHPNGFVVTDPKGKFMGELKNVHRHKEEFIQETYKKDGLKYQPGRNLRFDEKSQSFVRGGGAGYQRKYF